MITIPAHGTATILKVNCIFLAALGRFSAGFANLPCSWVFNCIYRAMFALRSCNHVFFSVEKAQPGGEAGLKRSSRFSPLPLRWAAMRPSVLFALLLILCGCDQSFRQDSSSMSPTIPKGEIVYLDASAYSSTTPKRWDVIVFTHPQKQVLWCARVVGLPGETISIENGGISINGSLQAQPDSIKLVRYVPSIPDVPAPISFPYKVSAGSYFVLGDNSPNALDSRFWGTVPTANILGRVKNK